ncbi:hypothetical protein NDU88_003271 [Pleurodeles waltl]|uniref:Uncharacterized protein n=1 Tax=Pleurodeles waltl TaxID=8319 RepID=A0AAV7NFX6_PLEWA|nr:hypothetical protein NDU88_003271 [Pleurodeles waltl]
MPPHLSTGELHEAGQGESSVRPELQSNDALRLGASPKKKTRTQPYPNKRRGKRALVGAPRVPIPLSR